MQIQDLIMQRFSGTLNNEAEYISLMVQVFAVLVLGLVAWRLMLVFHKRKSAKRKRSTFFKSTYSDHWRK